MIIVNLAHVNFMVAPGDRQINIRYFDGGMSPEIPASEITVYGFGERLVTGWLADVAKAGEQTEEASGA